MKLNKFFMLGLAGLAFAACSGEEDATQGVATDGNGVVSVKIVKPEVLTRNAGDATTAGDGQKVDITGKITVTLTGDNGTYNKSIEIDAATLTSTTELKFWNVKNPTKITASINGGVADYSSTSLTGLQVAANVIPAYGETITFTPGGKDSPTVPDVADDTEAGATADDEGKQYDMYKANVVMAIPVARLEVGGIKHTTAHTPGSATDCKYSALTIDGAYMDNIMTKGSAYANGKFGNGTVSQDYCFAGDTKAQDELDAILFDKIGTDNAGADFLKATNPFGTYTYNFYTGGTPTFKLFFKTAAGHQPNTIGAPRYAMITKFWKAGTEEGTKEAVTFQPGKIYRITEAVLDDKNIIGDEDGNTLYGVEVTVTEAQWGVQIINADWAEQ